MGTVQAVAGFNNRKRGTLKAPVLSVLEILLKKIRAAADKNFEAVWEEAEAGLFELLGSRAEFLVNAAGRWISWRQLETPDIVSSESKTIDDLNTVGLALPPDGRFITIREGSIIARLQRPLPQHLEPQVLAIAAQTIDMALTLCDGQTRLVRSTGELYLMRSVATHVLKTHDLDELFLFVVHETRRLLASDICGVMMRDGDELRMKTCVGNFSVETAMLRMAPGVGVAGHVLASGKPCVIPDYVNSKTITKNFVPLARTEKVRSALAVPIISQNDVVGVLEVWRRRPSSFSVEDTQLLQALAGLASVAIDNATLIQSQEKSALALQQAHQELADRYLTISQVSAFQQEISRLLLEENPLPAIAARTGEFTQGTILILNKELSVEVSQVDNEVDASSFEPTISSIIRNRVKEPNDILSGAIGDLKYLVQPIGAWTEQMGWIVWIGADTPVEVTRLALAHVALTTAVNLLERKRLGQERSKTLESVLWDLLDGSPLVRAAAFDRARELHVPIKGDCRVILISFSDLISNKGNIKQNSTLHDEVLERIHLWDAGRFAYLVGMRGGQVRLICKASDTSKLVASLRSLLESFRLAKPPLQAIIGISGVNGDTNTLPEALREARVALEVARYRKGNNIACHDELGVLGLLVDLRNNADLARISDQVLGGLRNESEQSRRTLLDTLSVFFQCDCSHADTARQLRVHQKTIAYRMTKICRLTGLDLSSHHDRLLADVATKLTSMIEMCSVDDERYIDAVAD